MSNDTPYHIPALLEPTIDGLITDPNGVYVDCTMGGGGHTRAILQRLGPDGRLLAFDQDLDARKNVPDDPRVTFVHANFRFIRNFIRYYHLDKVDGILADIGVSFHHFDDPERGFSFRVDAPLDMRMNREMEKSAADYIRDCSEQELTAILISGTDLKNCRKIAASIIKEREKEPILTTTQLVEAVTPVLNPRTLKKDLAQIFQAFRIHVNRELNVLEVLLNESVTVLKPGGRIAILSYHSLEDRMVKNFFKTGYTDPAEAPDPRTMIHTPKTPWKVITRNAIAPSEEEIEANPRSRSAKLRIAERNENPWPALP